MVVASASVILIASIWAGAKIDQGLDVTLMSAVAFWWSAFFIVLTCGAITVWALIIHGRPNKRSQRLDHARSVAEGEAADHDAFLRAYLAGCDEPCPICGYNLRGLVETVCPEYGEVLRLRVSLSEPKMAAYLCGLIALSMGVGFSGIMFAYLVVFALLNYMPWTVFNSPMGVLLVQIAIEGLAGWAWLVRRNWIRRRSRGKRWALAVSAWGCTIGFAVLFFIMAYDI